MLKPGDAVECYEYWCQTPRGPLGTWFRGYVLRRFEKDEREAIVVHTTGAFAGCEVRYSREHVRVETEASL